MTPAKSSKSTNSTISVHQLHLGHVVLPDAHPRADEQTCQIYCYVIDHPDGLVVVDTGPRAGHPVIDDLYAPQVVSIIDAINEAGLDDRDVAALVNTHLHFDHCGQNHRFANTPIWITAAEHEISTTDHYTVPEWASIGAEKLRLSADGESIADGVRLLHTPGHTPGHQSVAVDTVRGLELIVGQACYTCAEYRAASPAATDMHDPSWQHRGLESLARLRSLGADRAHFSHDATTYHPSFDAV
jgi:N-acyl homoserine lactone hydrolase